MKHWFRENRGLLLFLLLLGVTRTSLADWNHIPSGSMRPTLLEGDVVLVNRMAYDLKLPFTQVTLAQRGEPARGDVVVFRSPRDATRLIKRVVGLPGDTIEMRGKALLVNGEPAAYDTEGTAGTAAVVREQLPGHVHTIQWEAAVGAADWFGPVTVPPGYYLVLGDNRDHSADSRYFGWVQRRLLIGRAERVLVSADVGGSFLPRFERFGRSLR